MRKAIFVLLSGVMLGGCLESDDDDSFSGFIEDNPGNDAPVMTGSPERAVLVNDMYVFEPQAEDPDGDPLTFTVRNKPEWAYFEWVSGRLYGQPTAADIGTYNDIVLSVSDGSESDSMTFSVTVTDSAAGSVSLDWQPPTQNEDGSALTDLAGYKIYYGKTSGQYDKELDIGNPSATTFIVGNLLPATYYFAATAYNSVGVESDFSGEAVRRVN